MKTVAQARKAEKILWDERIFSENFDLDRKLLTGTNFFAISEPTTGFQPRVAEIILRVLVCSFKPYLAIYAEKLYKNMRQDELRSSKSQVPPEKGL